MTGAVLPVGTFLGGKNVSVRRTARVDQIFDKQRIALLGIEDVMGLVAVAAQARFDFKRGRADMRVAHYQIETVF